MQTILTLSDFVITKNMSFETLDYRNEMFAKNFCKVEVSDDKLFFNVKDSSQGTPEIIKIGSDYQDFCCHCFSQVASWYQADAGANYKCSHKWAVELFLDENCDELDFCGECNKILPIEELFANCYDNRAYLCNNCLDEAEEKDPHFDRLFSKEVILDENYKKEI